MILSIGNKLKIKKSCLLKNNKNQNKTTDEYVEVEIIQILDKKNNFCCVKIKNETFFAIIQEDMCKILNKIL